MCRTVLVRERLARILDERGVSQATLARRMKEEPYWLNNRLTGRTEIKADEVEQIAGALKISACALVDDEVLDRTLRGQGGQRAPETTAPPSASPTDIDAERLYRLYLQVWGDNPQDVEAYLEFLDWKRSRGK